VYELHPLAGGKLTRTERVLEAYFQYEPRIKNVSKIVLALAVVGGSYTAYKHSVQPEHSGAVSVVSMFEKQYKNCLGDTEYASSRAQVHEFTDGDMRGVDVIPTEHPIEAVTFVYNASPGAPESGYFVAQAADPTRLGAIAAIDAACKNVLATR
jgi:hypothetical protein